MKEFIANDSLDLFAKRWVLLHDNYVNNMVGQLLTFIESITPDGEQQRARKQLIRKIVYSVSNEMLGEFRNSADDLRKHYGYLEGEPEENWDASGRETK